MAFVQWGVVDRSWRGAEGKYEMAGSGGCQCTGGLGWGCGGEYWSLSGLEFEEDVSGGCAYRLGGLGIAMVCIEIVAMW